MSKKYSNKVIVSSKELFVPTSKKKKQEITKKPHIVVGTRASE